MIWACRITWDAIFPSEVEISDFHLISNGIANALCHITKVLFFSQVELEGLTGTIRFGENGRRHNYTLHVYEMTVNSALVKVAEWADGVGLTPVAPKYNRHKLSRDDLNKTYIVTTLLVR